MSTLVTLRGRLRTNLNKVDPNGRIWADAVLDQNINEAVNAIQDAGNYDWSFNEAVVDTFNTVISQATYNLDSNFKRLELTGEGSSPVTYDNRPMTIVSYRQLFSDYANNLAATGTPQYAYLANGNTKIGFYPIPNAVKAVQVLHKIKLTAMTGDVDDSGMPSEFDEAIVAYAELLCWDSIADDKRKANALDKYNRALGNLLDDIGTENEANYFFDYPTI